MQLKTFYLQDKFGNALPGALCYVYEHGTTTLVTTLRDADGQPLGNPVSADAAGAVQVAAPDGLYSVRTVAGVFDRTVSVQFIDHRPAALAMELLELHGSNVDAVSENITQLQTVAGNVTQLQQVAPHVGAINTAVGYLETIGQLDIAAQVEQARADALAAAAASGNIKFFKTLADAQSATPTLGEGDVVEILLDETNGNTRYRYIKRGGVLEPILLLDFLQDGGNAVPRTVLQKLRDTISVSDYAGDLNASFQSAVERLRAVGGGSMRMPVPTSRWMDTTNQLEMVGQFSNGAVLNADKANIRTATTDQNGLFVGNRPGEIGYAYLNKFKIRDLVLEGRGKVGAGAGVVQNVAADIQFDNTRISLFPVGMKLQGGLSSEYVGTTLNACGIGLLADFSSGVSGLNDMAPNANSFYGARFYANDVAVKYLYNPSGAVNWIGSNFEGNNVGGTRADGKKVIELSNAGHHNFFGCHSESNLGQYGIYYHGFDASKNLLLVGCEFIDDVGTNVHIERGRLTSVGSRITNGASPEDIHFDEGTSGTLIDTEGSLHGDLKNVLSIREGKLGFGAHPVKGASSPVIDMRPDNIAEAGNVAMRMRNDKVQLLFQNTAGARIAYINIASTGDHALVSDVGGWRIVSNGQTFYFGRGGAAAIEPGANNAQDCGSGPLRWRNTYSHQFRPGPASSPPIWTSGTGSPEGALSANVGSLYTRTDGGAGTTLYVKESGTGATGWVAK